MKCYLAYKLNTACREGALGAVRLHESFDLVFDLGGN